MKMINWLLILILLSASNAEASEYLVNMATGQHARVAPNFTAKEFRCSHCGKSKTSGALLFRLELLRSELGNKKIYINSGYRCAVHNRQVKGAKNSQHMYGKAADVHVDGVSPSQVAMAAKRCGFTFIKTYKTWTHVDVR
jgi:zinc D-Ala-D-Ala carboxypeptidase